MGRPPDHAPAFQHSDDPGHRGRLHLLVLGQLARGHPIVLFQRGERGQLRIGKLGLQPLRHPLGAHAAG